MNNETYITDNVRSVIKYDVYYLICYVNLIQHYLT